MELRDGSRARGLKDSGNSKLETRRLWRHDGVGIDAGIPMTLETRRLWESDDSGKLPSALIAFKASEVQLPNNLRASCVCNNLDGLKWPERLCCHPARLKL